ncbi:MAG: hypothetical protein GXY55_03275 [Phycisphaerae bacterium]|nr:hypothetical protein [Phycisphaerae bacterium]
MALRHVFSGLDPGILAHTSPRVYNGFVMVRLVIAILFLGHVALPTSACSCASDHASGDAAAACCGEPETRPACCGCRSGASESDCSVERDSCDNTSHCPCAVRAIPQQPVAPPTRVDRLTLDQPAVVSLLLIDDPARQSRPLCRRTSDADDLSDTHQERQAKLSVWLC